MEIAPAQQFVGPEEYQHCDKMFDLTNYENVFPAGFQVPYDRKFVHEIEGYRKTFEGVLFIDRVLTALGISKSKAYPPKNEAALRPLHQQICETNMSMHHKLSLFYYILLDFPAANDRSTPSETFAVESGVPLNYQIFMKGLWYMDRHDFPKALEHIAYPSLIPDFADDIITILVRHAQDNDYSLALSYFNTVQPILKTATALEYLFDAIAQTSVTEAILFSRTHPEHTREVLFRRLIAGVLSIDHSAETSSHLSDLAFYPFDNVEEAWFVEYLSTGDGHSLKRSKDVLLIRRIAADDFDEATKQRVGSQWASIIQGIKGGIDGQIG
ncbi:Protein ELYS [Paramyrothecium foliicola]|nr:Protein ELYS [Paramyrothecium foliicola]